MHLIENTCYQVYNHYDCYNHGVFYMVHPQDKEVGPVEEALSNYA